MTFRVTIHPATAHAPLSGLFADCPKCGGYPDLDEDGRPYTCFYCCDTGRVPAECAQEEEQERADQCEYRRLTAVVDGKHIVQCCDEYEGWDELRPLLPAAVFPKPAPVVSDGLDDIPF